MQKTAYRNAIKLLRLARARRDIGAARAALARARHAAALVALGHM